MSTKSPKKRKADAVLMLGRMTPHHVRDMNDEMLIQMIHHLEIPVAEYLNAAAAHQVSDADESEFEMKEIDLDEDKPDGAILHLSRNNMTKARLAMRYAVENLVLVSGDVKKSFIDRIDRYINEQSLVDVCAIDLREHAAHEFPETYRFWHTLNAGRSR